ncbi:MAG: presenilin family intramembrane aspartyl protease [Candidatus Nanohaloarchaea archaeon]|nr:presenilin family intramembrane aspartyl protease [Candidatus Nanohaloarchaea archaeon]
MERERVPFLLVGLFLVSNLLGLTAALQLYGVPAVEKAAAVYRNPTSGAVFFGILLLATTLLLLLYRLNREFLVKAWFLSALFITSLIFFDAFLPVAPSAALALLLLGIRSRGSGTGLRNLMDTIPFAGAGALFGVLLGFRAALILFGLLAIYDYIAVNHLGHMVSLAKEGLSSGTLMGFQYPKDRELGKEKTEMSGNSGSGSGGGEGQARIGMLGGGDVIMPMVLAVSIVPLFGVWAAVSTVAGSAAFLFVFLTAVQRREAERFYPAIPVVGSGAILGLMLHLSLSLL